MKRTMKWAACAALLLAGAGSVSAQNLRLQPVGEVVRTGGERIYSIPSTTLVVELMVQKETVVTGPYARFAQKYFGVIAPLADKENYTIVAAAVRAEDTGRPALRRETAADDRPAPAPADRPRPQEERGALSRLQPDRMSMESQSLESAAQKAAEAIFYMRSRRAELVLGDYAETVYGAGLQTAVERIDRMEREYVKVAYADVPYLVQAGVDFHVLQALFWNDSAWCPMQQRPRRWCAVSVRMRAYCPTMTSPASPCCWSAARRG